MTTSAAQLRFAAEFATFLVAAAGFTVVLLRPGLAVANARSRAALALGFLGVGSAAFVRGSLQLDEPQSLLLAALRAAGVVLLGLGALDWKGQGGSRRVFWLGLALLAAAEATLAVEAEVESSTLVTVGDVARVIGALAVGGALFTVSRRAIAARVAATAAATLLLMVLAMSVALSTVLSSNVETEAVRRSAARAESVTGLITGSDRENQVKTAFLVATTLVSAGRDLPGLAAEPVYSRALEGDLLNLSRVLFSTGPLMFVTRNGTIVARVGVAPRDDLILAGSPVVTEALQPQGTERSAVQVVGDRAMLVGVKPVVVRTPDGTSTLVGAVVAATAIDSGYLESRGAGTESLAVVGRERLLARTGPTNPDVVRVGQQAVVAEAPVSAVTEDLVLAAHPVRLDDGTVEVAVVAGSPLALVERTRESLFRTLFLVALGASLVALVIASLVGERIGAGLRALTRAAEGIRRGDLGVRAGVAGDDDEVGILGEAFDSMAGSIQSLAGDLRQAADDEARLRNRVEAIVAGMGEALVAVDADGRITAFNGAAEALVGVSAERALGRPVAAVVELSGDGEVDLSARMARPSPEAWSTKAEIVRPDGSRVPVAVSGGALRGAASELAGGVYVLRDRRREREIERMKTEFLSNVSHELRTPLTPIKGYAEMLRSRPVPPDKSRIFVEEILHASDRLEQVIDQLLVFASMEAGRLQLRKETVRVKDLLDRVTHRWGSRLEGSRELTRRIARGIPDVHIDPQLVERSLDALIDNADKFSPAGGKISVTALPFGNGDRPAVQIAVTDEGEGVPDDYQSVIFDPFTQVDPSATRVHGGMGIGLAFVRRIARAHEGELLYQSVRGRNTTFSIVLPAVPKERR